MEVAGEIKTKKKPTYIYIYGRSRGAIRGVEQVEEVWHWYGEVGANSRIPVCNAWKSWSGRNKPEWIVEMRGEPKKGPETRGESRPTPFNRKKLVHGAISVVLFHLSRRRTLQTSLVFQTLVRVWMRVWVESKQHAIHYASIGGIMGAAIGRRRVEPLSSTWSFRGSFLRGVEGKSFDPWTWIFDLISPDLTAILFHDPVTSQLENKLGWLRVKGNLCVLFSFFFFLKGFEQTWISFEFIIWFDFHFTLFTVYLYVEFKLFFFPPPPPFSCKFLSRVRSSTKKFQRTCVHSEDKHRLFEARGTSVELVIKRNNEEELWLKQISETFEIKWSNSSIQFLHSELSTCSRRFVFRVNRRVWMGSVDGYLSFPTDQSSFHVRLAPNRTKRTYANSRFVRRFLSSA